MSHDDEEIPALLKILLILLLTPLACLAHGWAIRTLWGWFITPTFHVAAPSIAMSLGLGILVGLVTHQYVGRNDREQLEAQISGILSAALYVGMGWIVHLFAR